MSSVYSRLGFRADEIIKVHDIDLLRHLFGDIVRVYAEEGVSTRGHEVEETGACTLKFLSGAIGTFIFSEYVSFSFILQR